jgi:hypothetical protein
MARRPAASRRNYNRNRKRRRGDGTLVRLLVPLCLLIVLGLIAFLVLRPTAKPEAVPTKPACPVVPDVVVGNYVVPAGPIAGYCQSQLINAAQIMRAAQHWTSDNRAKEIGVMTAIGESSLNNLNYGDTAGPDSRGLFQQRANYGSLALRMDPYTAASAFFQRMLGVPHWNTRPPTEVAHLVQVNANPNYYTPYFPRAVTIVDTLTGDRVPPPLTVISSVRPTTPALPAPPQ